MDRYSSSRKYTALEHQLAEQLDRRAKQSKLRILKSSPANSIDLSSNDFLSLATNAEFRRDLIRALQQDIRPVGSTGSRLLDGNSTYAEKIERQLSRFHGAPTGLLTNSGFDANVSIFMSLPQPGDIIVFDELIHASVYDGMRQSRSELHLPFKHNSVENLAQVLRPYEGMRKTRNIFVAVESVYSMDGDLAPLAEFVSLIDLMFPDKNCHLVVDEAHATGVYGPKGRGRVCELGLEAKVPVRLHTFGKALACNGAIILCSEVIKSYLINYARPLIYTTFMSYSSLTAVKVIYDWLEAGKTEPLAENLFRLITHLHIKLQSLLNQISDYPDILTIPTTCPDSPIFALVSDQPRALAAHCQAAGFVVRAVMPPTVPEGTARVRVCLHAGNNTEQIDRLVDCIVQWTREQIHAIESVRSSAADVVSRPSGAKRVEDIRATGVTRVELISKL